LGRLTSGPGKRVEMVGDYAGIGATWR
jgi:hypothetical protein